MFGKISRRVTITTLSVIFVMTVLITIVYGSWIAPIADNIYVKMKVFTAVLQTIQRVYVEEVDPDSLVNDAIHGMLQNLDPHTNYMTSDDVKKWSQRYEGYSGIGISFAIINNKITVMSVMEGGPSYRLGFRPGDRIVKINSESAIGIKQDDVPKKLMGPAGTSVNVSLEREGWKEPREYSIVREEIHVKSVPNSLLMDDGIGYVRIARFASTTEEELEEALQKLESKGLERLILDLRGNSGGYLQMAVKVSEKFLPSNKMIVYTKGRIPQAYREYHSSPNTQHRMIPLIILIDQGSASASEIVAGAVQDWDRGLILGKTSFGKGLVQTQYPFTDGSVLLITTARYYTPSGRLIQRDYDDQSWDDYYREAYIDSLRNENMVDLPKFKTFAGRVVYGGGGISPDYWLESTDEPVSEFVKNIAYSDLSNRYIYSFSEEILREHPEIKTFTARQFAKNFRMTNAEIESFAQFVIDKGYEAAKKDFLDNSEDLIFLIKREIAYRLWGDEGYFHINLLRDSVLQAAPKYFDDAKQLLSISMLKTND